MNKRWQARVIYNNNSTVNDIPFGHMPVSLSHNLRTRKYLIKLTPLE